MATSILFPPEEINKLVEALGMTFTGADQSLIRSAEQYVKQCKGVEGFIPTLLMIVGNDKNDANIRLSAIAALKNEVKDHWIPKMNSNGMRISKLSENDRKILKDNILDAMVHSIGNKQLVGMYEVILEIMLNTEYPNNWQDLCPGIINRMKTASSYPEMIGMLVAFKRILQKYECELDELREPLELHVLNVFPILENVSATFLKNYDDQAAFAMNVILKTLFAAIHLDLPPYFMDQGNMKTWMDIVRTLLEKPIPPELESPIENDDVYESRAREKNYFWRNRHWCGRILVKFMQKYANPKWETNQTKGFWRFYQETYALGFLDAFMGILASRRQKQVFVAPKTAFFAFKYILYSLKQPKTFEAMLPHIETLLFDICLPSLQLTLKDEEIWKTEPMEYIRREDDTTFNGSNCKNAAMEVIDEACGKDCNNDGGILHNVFKYLGCYLLEGKEPRNGTPLDLITKEAIFFAIIKLRELLIKSGLIDQMEYIIENSVLNELSSSVGFLRARACDVLYTFGGDFDFTNRNIIKSATQGVCSCLQDPEMPVRIKAALALNCLMTEPEALDLLRPHLADALREYIALMEIIDSDDVVQALEGIIESFSNEISPFAYDLVVSLTDSFFKYCNEDKEGGQGDDNEEESVEETNEVTQAASGCLVAIKRILLSKLPHDIYPKLENTLTPMLDYCLCEDIIGFVEEACDILNIMLYNLDNFSAKMWSYYPQLVYIIVGRSAEMNKERARNKEHGRALKKREKGWQNEFIVYQLGCFENYIGKCRPMFLEGKDITGTSFVELLFKSIDHIITTCVRDEKSEVDVICVSTLFICLIENYAQIPESIDQLIPLIIDKCLEHITNEKRTAAFKAICVEVIAMACWYNARLTLSYLDSKNGALQYFFETWYALIPQFKYDFDKQRILLGFSAILRLPTNEIPSLVVSAWTNLGVELYRLTNEILELREKGDAMNQCEEADEDNDATLFPYQNNNSPSFVNGKKSTMAKVLYGSRSNEDNKAKPSDYQNFLSQLQSGNIPEDDEEEEDQDFEEDNDVLAGGAALLYSSPLEEMDEIIYFGESLEILKNNDGSAYDQFLTSLGEKERGQLANNFQIAQQQFLEYQSKKQKSDSPQG